VRLFDDERLRQLRETYAPKSSAKDDVLADEYLLAQEGRYRVYYAALGALPNPSAKVVLVGLTPGLSQVQKAADLFLSTSTVVREDFAAYSTLLRKHVSFAGTMRANLCTMLDELDLPRYLGIERTDALFATECQALAATSALVYPVFTGEARSNFGGGSAPLGNTTLFRHMLEELLAPRLDAVPQALVIPLGKAASTGLDYLVEARRLSDDSVLRGFPHPSGGNGHRVAFFRREKDRLQRTLRQWFDRG
jgi:hypothetical protein